MKKIINNLKKKLFKLLKQQNKKFFFLIILKNKLSKDMIQIMKNFVRSIFKENFWVKKCEKRFFFIFYFFRIREVNFNLYLNSGEEN